MNRAAVIFCMSQVSQTSVRVMEEAKWYHCYRVVRAIL